MERPRTAALIVAAGRGTRAGGPKQFRALGGRPILAWSYDALAGHDAIGQVLVVIGAGQEAALVQALGDVPFVIGGATRQASVRAGLEALDADGVERVLVHDAARPFLPGTVIDALLTALDADSGATAAIPVTDTLARGIEVLGDTVPRGGMVRIQTPQAFHLPELLAAHRAWPEGEAATDDAQILRRAGHDVALVAGDPALDKITFPADFARAEAMLAACMVSRTATGFDVHRLEAGEELWLGGMLIPHDKGLSGHSDADVALHAITDALLGTIGAGDIGQHFPPSDSQWKGARSDQFLAHAATLVRAAGGIIDFVDLTLMCEAPKIGPHREGMRDRIAQILQLPPAHVSVKATTTERLGFTGRGEGIAALASATVRVPGQEP
ncbi:bifunctional 2-C-methyl-D-erythritol 4-phosphate cytidylyltransferase/2-C-methyl-D-erythritol 2,4-cyclodiphosphate synthase [Sphingomonas spermidinifaciens]|uniref:Bifunctional enzyme IspD/IspF n=1 Tax=Sphingomonas spermidinifaciens TaxID=1141889 RepID=A0A2A4B514_9SPHN|nr:bifunctional 2-C-methyl-D-erythritol 4-phosphate cytidylyltransferase/2-C-methyl-D-erythritol 2,4-cyclodiphosphate synthase [Sphingomonas spermidinifaciens]PCD03042.1 bifunctional 2-C-methyl-D-erythritol 4-phosphate cytidylyltransferase/2-C-methyl-D-erythritol 2,4-cyclodiphosphate synthase [Sphingomonas spermidinifaciens]